VITTRDNISGNFLCLAMQQQQQQQQRHTWSSGAVADYQGTIRCPDVG